MTEFEVIEKLAEIFGQPKPPVLGIGDDTAVFEPPPGKEVLWTTDSYVEKIHFRWDWMTPRQIGFRAAGGSLSDIAAMGGVPTFGLVSFHFPSHVSLETVLEIARGLNDGFSAVSAQILGGNLSRSSTFAMEVSALGLVEKGGALRRNGAKPGEDLFVTGTPGTSAFALEILKRGWKNEAWAKPLLASWYGAAPRIKEGQELVGLASSCIDISDGLLQDAGHIAKASNVDLEIELERLPTPTSFKEISEHLKAPIDPIRFSPSDDYELLFTVPTSAAKTITKRLPNATRIGTVRGGTGKVRVLDGNRKELTFPNAGWDHLEFWGHNTKLRN